jgi:hypothetical protein
LWWISCVNRLTRAVRSVFSSIRRSSGATLDCRLLTLEALLGERLAVLRVRLGVELVPVRVPCLREQDQRRRVGGVGRERQVEQDERVRVDEDLEKHDPHDDEVCAMM